jgi:hypothetical protein
MRLRQRRSEGTCVGLGRTWASPVSANELEAAPTASIVTAFAAASVPPCRWAGWWASSGKLPRPVWMKQNPHELLQASCGLTTAPPSKMAAGRYRGSPIVESTMPLRT